MSTVNLAQTGTWIIDASHSSLEFVVRHLMVSKVRGRFASFAGTVAIAESVENSTVEVSIDAASITTNDAKRDGRLVSEDFLQVDAYPTMTFRGSSARPASGDTWVIPGELTIKDVTRSVDLEVEYMGVFSDPWGNPKAAFSAVTEFDREEFGITWNATLESGGVLVDKTVRIELDIQLQSQDRGQDSGPN